MTSRKLIQSIRASENEKIEIEVIKGIHKGEVYSIDETNVWTDYIELSNLSFNLDEIKIKKQRRQ